MAATKTSELAKLRQVEVTERRRAREAELAANAAKADADQRRSMLVEAHAAGDARAIKAAEKVRGEAVDRSDNAGIEAEGAQMRAERAGRERTRYEAENARALIAECEPAGIEAAKRLEQAAADLLAADATWFGIRQVCADLLDVTPGASAAADLMEGHSLTEIARQLRRTSIEIAPPLPHYRGLEHHAAERERAEELRQLREQGA